MSGLRTVRLTGSKLSVANSFKNAKGEEPKLNEASVASQVRSERRQRGEPLVTVLRQDLSTPGDTWAVSVFRRGKDAFEVRAYQPATGCEVYCTLAFCEVQGRKRVRNSQLQRLISRSFSTRFG